MSHQATCFISTQQWVADLLKFDLPPDRVDHGDTPPMTGYTFYRFTDKDAGDDAIDSDVDPNTGYTDAFNLTTSGEYRDDLDAGIYTWSYWVSGSGSLAADWDTE